MKVVIVGPGAIGLLFAAFLHRGNNEVWLLDKDKSRAQMLDSKGIRVEGVSGKWEAKIKATSATKDIGKAELVILAVKSYSTKAAAEAIGSLVDDNSFLLSIQNGIDNIETLTEYFDKDRVVAGLTNQASTYLGIGSLRHAGKGDTIIGMLDKKMGVGLRQIREVLNKAGLDCRITKDIKGAAWSKLIVNAGINPLSAITRLPNGKLTSSDSIYRIMKSTVNEAVKVAKRKRIKLAFEDPVSKVERVCQATSDNISSMLQDVLNKKRTEIDSINAAIVRQAETLGIKTPVNSFLVDIIKTIENTYSHQI